MLIGTFWKVCIVWAVLLLGVVGWRAVMPTSMVMRELVSINAKDALPEIGAQLELPDSAIGLDGNSTKLLDQTRLTFVLLASAGCPASQAELNTYADLLGSMTAEGAATRLIVRPGEPHEMVAFLRNAPPGATIIVDSLNLAHAGFRTRVTPSVVLVDPRGVVVGAFMPPDNWPVTRVSVAEIMRGSEAWRVNPSSP